MPVASIRSKAWLLRGLGSVPGELNFSEGCLAFVAHGFGTLWKRQLHRLEHDAHLPGLAQRMDKGHHVPVFQVPLDQARAVFPWYYFSGGFKLIVGGSQYRFSFVKPNNDSTMGPGPGLAEARRFTSDWRTLLQTGSASPGGL